MVCFGNVWKCSQMRLERFIFGIFNFIFNFIRAERDRYRGTESQTLAKESLLALCAEVNCQCADRSILWPGKKFTERQQRSHSIFFSDGFSRSLSAVLSAGSPVGKDKWFASGVGIQKIKTKIQEVCEK